MKPQQTSNNRKKTIFIFFVMVVLQSLLLIYLMNNKLTLFCDEIYSYSLSNSPFGILFETEDKSSIQWNSKWIDSQVLKDYIGVSRDNSFNYKNVYYNQTLDCHPPLFYYVIHTICSFFPASFSKWYGFTLNIIIFILVQILLFILSKKIFDSDKNALLTCFIYGFSSCSIDCFIFIRMYSLLTLLYLLYLYLNVSYLEKNNFYCLLSISLVALLGALTQYHFYIYAFSIISTMVLINKTNKIFGIILANLFGFTLANLYFPYFFQHLFNNSNGVAALDISERISPCIFAISYLFQEFLGFNRSLSVVISIFLIIILCIFVIIYFVKHYFDKNNTSLLMVYISSFIYMIIVFFTVNYKYFGIILTGRYFFPICPMIIIAVMAILYKQKKKYLTVLLTILILASNLQMLDFYYPYSKKNADILQLENIIKNNNLILYCNATGIIHSLCIQLMKTNKIFINFYFSPKYFDFNKITFPDNKSTYLLIYPSDSLRNIPFPKVMEGNIEFWPNHFGLYEINNIKKH